MRLLVAGALALIVVAAPSVAHADAAGGTDYRTEIVAVRPSPDALEISVVGGDAFIEATVAPGHELVVLGYRPDQEPYLRIRSDGVVEHNVRSYATYYNVSRYGTDAIPDVVDTTAPPQWEPIGDGGTWAWHDHRAHWMGAGPIGLDRGESLPSEVIPLVFDGERVDVEVVTTYLPEPSPWPGLVGLLVGLQVGLVAVWIGRATAVLALIVLSAFALAAGLAQYWSLPPSTGPLVTWWLMPALALGAAVLVIATYGRSMWRELGLGAFAALQLGVWGWQRRDHLTSAFVPTSLPMDLDRAITAAVLAGSTLVLVGVARALWHTVRPAAPAASTAA